MKKSYFSTIVTVIVATLIITACYFLVRQYMSGRQQRNLNKVEHAKINYISDNSAESIVFNNASEHIMMDDFKETKISSEEIELVKKMTKSLRNKEVGVYTAYKCQDKILVKWENTSETTFVLYDKKTNEFDIHVEKVDYRFDHNNKDAVLEELQKQIEDDESELTNIVTQLCVHLSEYDMDNIGLNRNVDWDSKKFYSAVLKNYDKDLLIHNNIVYIVYGNSYNYIVLQYNFNSREFVGLKII